MAGDQWYYSKAGSDEKHGPVTTAELKELAAKGEIVPDDLIWCEGKSPDWVPAKSAMGLFAASSPPPLPSDTRTPSGAAADRRPPAGRTASPRRRASHATAAGISALPLWAKVLVGAAAGVLLLVAGAVLSGKPSASRSSQPAQTEHPTAAQRPLPQNAPATARSRAADAGPMRQPPRHQSPPATVQPPAFDTNLMIGMWGFRNAHQNGTSTFILDLLPDGMFGVSMMELNRAGATVQQGELEGHWRVSGRTLYLLQPDGSPGFTYLILVADGRRLEIQDVATGLLKPMVKVHR